MRQGCRSWCHRLRFSPSPKVRSGITLPFQVQSQLYGFLPHSANEAPRGSLCLTCSALPAIARAAVVPQRCATGAFLVLWPRLTSDTPSRSIAGSVAKPLAANQISRDKHSFFRSVAAGFTQDQFWKSRVSPPFAGSPTVSCLLSDFSSSARSCGLGFLQTPPHGDALAIA